MRACVSLRDNSDTPVSPVAGILEQRRPQGRRPSRRPPNRLVRPVLRQPMLGRFRHTPLTGRPTSVQSSATDPSRCQPHRDPCDGGVRQGRHRWVRGGHPSTKTSVHGPASSSSPSEVQPSGAWSSQRTPVLHGRLPHRVHDFGYRAAVDHVRRWGTARQSVQLPTVLDAHVVPSSAESSTACTSSSTVLQYEEDLRC